MRQDPPTPAVSIDWVQGFLDRACSVSAKKRAIEVTASWEGSLRTIYWALCGVGIKPSLRRRKAGGWVLRISGAQNLIIWARVGFKDPEKQAILSKIIIGIKEK